MEEKKKKKRKMSPGTLRVTSKRATPGGVTFAGSRIGLWPKEKANRKKKKRGGYSQKYQAEQQ